jgi:hypothetical protein
MMWDFLLDIFVFIKKFWHEYSTIRKKIPVSGHPCWPVQGTTANKTNPFNLLSKFTAEAIFTDTKFMIYDPEFHQR